YALVSAVVTDEIEGGHPVVIAGDSFAIDDAGARAQACQRLNDQREAAGGGGARGGLEPHPRPRLACDDGGALILDFLQPLAAGRQFIGFGWETWRDEPGRERTLQHNAHT